MTMSVLKHAMHQVTAIEDGEDASGAPVRRWLRIAIGVACASGRRDKEKKGKAMHTRKSFLALAALAQLASPVANGRAHPRSRAPTLRAPAKLLQHHPGRDVHFHNDLEAGRLTILDLRHAAGLAAGTPGADILRVARLAAGSGHAQEFYLYSLTRQAAFDKAADLERYMAWYGTAGGLVLPACAKQEVKLLRLRFGVCRIID